MPATTTSAPEDTVAAPAVVVARGGWRAAIRRHLALLLWAAAGLGIALSVWLGRADIGLALSELRNIDLSWLAVAMVAVSISISAFAATQRRLLYEGGVRVPRPSMLAITYASNAVSLTVPVAGGAGGAAFSYSQYLRRGADGALAGWTLVMAGVISSVSLAVLLGLAAGFEHDTTLATVGLSTAALGVLPLVLVVVALRSPRARARLEGATRRVALRVGRRTKRGGEGTASAVASQLDRFASFRLSRRGGAYVSLTASVNWVADAICLAACVAAFRTPVPWTHLALVYGGLIGAVTIGFTPAGIGVVEGALAAVLVSAGLPTRTAIPAALLYRLTSCWLVLAIGWVVFASMRRLQAREQQRASRARPRHPGFLGPTGGGRVRALGGHLSCGGGYPPPSSCRWWSGDLSAPGVRLELTTCGITDRTSCVEW